MFEMLSNYPVDGGLNSPTPIRAAAGSLSQPIAVVLRLKGVAVHPLTR